MPVATSSFQHSNAAKWVYFSCGIVGGWILSSLLNKNKPTTQPNASSTKQVERMDLISYLDLIAHPEGGYFIETYRSGSKPMTSKGETDLNGTVIPWKDGQKANIMTMIFYMLDKKSPQCSMHIAGPGKDSIHTFVMSSSPDTTVTFTTVDPDTWQVTERIMGPSIHNGHKFEVIVPGHHWKTIRLNIGTNDKTETPYCIMSEAMAPGFDCNHWKLVDINHVRKSGLSEKNKNHVLKFVKKEENQTFQSYYDE